MDCLESSTCQNARKAHRKVNRTRKLIIGCQPHSCKTRIQRILAHVHGGEKKFHAQYWTTARGQQRLTMYHFPFPYCRLELQVFCACSLIYPAVKADPSGTGARAAWVWPGAERMAPSLALGYSWNAFWGIAWLLLLTGATDLNRQMC